MRPTCDTSVLVPALAAWHPEHEACRTAIAGVEVVPAHVLLEAYSVLTRLPAPHRIAPGDAAEVVAALPFATAALPEAEHGRLVAILGRQGIRGGATYDALVAATAAHHDLTLLTRDQRARRVYDGIGVRWSWV